MRNISFAILCIAILLYGIINFTDYRENLSYQSYQPVHPNTFFDNRYFTQEPLKEVGAPAARIRGTVVPHHLLAYKLIAQVFEQLKDQNPSLIILIGPNHSNQGNRIITSTWGWQTPFGIVEADKEKIESLLDSSIVKKEDDIFSTEHSMGNLMPFIKYFLPEAKVVPLIVHQDLTKEEAISLSEQLERFAEGGEAVILASIDFSHYLTNKEAQLKDQETLDILKTKNLSQILALGDSHLDSPGAMVTLLLTMERLGIEKFKILQHANSGQLVGNDLIETTSYITMKFESEGEN